MAKQKEVAPVEEGMANVTDPLATMPAASVTPPPPEEEGAPSVIDAALEAQVTALGRETAKKLKEEPQVEALIPLDPLNKHDKVVEVCINGWNIRILRNVWVKLPASVVDLLANAGYNPSTRNYVPKLTKPLDVPDLKIMPQ